MQRHVKRQNGAIMVMMAILVVVLVGIGALVLDLGRLLVLHTKMQNTADASALAGAFELNGQADARIRAVAAAKQLLTTKAHFAKNPDLVKSLTYDPADPQKSAFVFYSWIGSKDDPPAKPAGCTPDPDDAGKCLATGDADAYYMKVKLFPELAQGAGHYAIDLYFLPVLSIIPGIDLKTVEETKASAVAGRHYFICDYPPMMICDPYENSPGGWEANLHAGDMVVLKKQQGDTWAPGDFGFLLPRGEDDAVNDNGAKALGQYFADETKMRCTPPVVTTNPGGKTQWARWGLNTRFGLKGGGNLDGKSAPDVIDYPRDDIIVAPDFITRFGNGVWNNTEDSTRPSTYSRDDYVTYYHGGAHPAGSNLSRFDYYKWETDYDNWNWSSDPVNTPSTPPSAPDYHIPAFSPPPGVTINADERDCGPTANSPCRIWNGAPPPGVTVGDPDRRVLTVAVLECGALGINGKKTVQVTPPSGWAKFFLTEHVEPPSSDTKVTVFGEYIGAVSPEDENYHVYVQLYE